MVLSMPPENIFAFAAMIVLWTLLPGPGLAAVFSRALIAGPKAGFAVIAGLALADVIFMAIAVGGLFAVAMALGPMFMVVKYAGAVYLVWRGVQILLRANKSLNIESVRSDTLWRDAGVGLLITLGNPKAILFFGAILPLFVDMTTIGFVEFTILSGIVAGVSTFIYGAVAVLATRLCRVTASITALKRLRQVTGTLLIGSGVMVATR